MLVDKVVCPSHHGTVVCSWGHTRHWTTGLVCVEAEVMLAQTIMASCLKNARNTYSTELCDVA